VKTIMKTNTYITFIILTIAFLFLSCTEDVERSEIIGTYYFNSDEEQDSLILLNDSTYCQYYITTESTLVRICGYWSFTPRESKYDYANITFSNFITSLPTMGDMRLVFTTHIEKYGDKIMICVNEDENMYYIKCSPKQK